MAITLEEIYNSALMYIQEMNDDGTFTTADVQLYQKSAPRIVSSKQNEILRCLGMPPAPKISNSATASSTYMELEDQYWDVLAAGVAAEFALIGNKTDLYNVWVDKYDKLKNEMKMPLRENTDYIDVLSGMTD